MADHAAQILELQNVVGALRSQVLEITSRNDTQKAEMQTLKEESAKAWQQLRMAGADARGPADGGHRHPIRLVDAKSMRPEVFEGSRQKIRGWSTRMKAFANSIAPGFRKAMVWAERHKGRISIDDFHEMDWAPAEEADAALFDMLMTTTDGEPQGMVAGAFGDEAGFEAWRVLMQWYDPCN